jgi:hypothetical protein
VDSDRGVDGKLLREGDGRVGNSSSRVLLGEVIVAVRGHVREGVVVKMLRMSRKWGMRRLSRGSSPYMCDGVGVGSFELPHLIISEYVILIDPHVFRVRVPFPFHQILKSPSSAEMPGV